MKRTTCFLATVLLTLALACISRVHSEDSEASWETTIRYLKKYLEEDMVPHGTPKVTVSADQKKGTITITTSHVVGASSTTFDQMIHLKLVDADKLAVEEFTSPRVRNGARSYALAVESAAPDLMCFTNVTQQRGGGLPSQVTESSSRNFSYVFATEEPAKKALKAFQRGISLAKQAEEVDPFAEKPLPGTKPAEGQPAVESQAIIRRKADLAILDLKDEITKQANSLERAVQALEQCRQESRKLAELRRTETDGKKKALVIAAQVAMAAQEQTAIKAKIDCERILASSKADLARMEKGLADGQK